MKGSKGRHTSPTDLSCQAEIDQHGCPEASPEGMLWMMYENTSAVPGAMLTLPAGEAGAKGGGGGGVGGGGGGG